MRLLAGLLLALVALPLLGAPAAGQAQSWGVAPGVVTIGAAQAGQSYVATVQLQNQFDSQARVTVARSGVSGPWTTLSVADNFTLPPRTNQNIVLTVTVPGSQGPGRADGQVTFYREPDATPGGTGASIRQGAAVTLHVDVGGTAFEKLAWSNPRVEDAAEGAAVHGFATASNEGNVLTTAKLAAEVLPFTGSQVLGNATGSRDLRPGDQQEVEVDVAATLAPGQYRIHLHANGLDATLPFKVVAAGTVAPDGTLKALLHAPRGTAGEPVRIDGWFQNTGTPAIRSAVLKAEVRSGGNLLATLRSDPLAVAPGQSVNLTVYWTPPAGGTYTLAGTVLYDGFLTPESQSLLNVDARGAAQSLGWWWLLLLALLLVLAVAAWVVRRRRMLRAAKPAQRPPPRKR